MFTPLRNNPIVLYAVPLLVVGFHYMAYRGLAGIGEDNVTVRSADAQLISIGYVFPYQTHDVAHERLIISLAQSIQMRPQKLEVIWDASNTRLIPLQIFDHEAPISVLRHRAYGQPRD